MDTSALKRDSRRDHNRALPPAPCVTSRITSRAAHHRTATEVLDPDDIGARPMVTAPCPYYCSLGCFSSADSSFQRKRIFDPRRPGEGLWPAG